jgi:hypothetical protein
LRDLIALGVAVMAAKFMRRKDAGKYLFENYGFSSEQALAKLACVGGGPVFHYVGTGKRRIVLYAPDDLDSWAREVVGEPQRSTAR